MSLPRALLSAAASALELWSARWSEAAKAHPQRQFYRGYRQGVIDGRDGAEHALKWLAGKDGE
jgi:hypothetical protein